MELAMIQEDADPENLIVAIVVEYKLSQLPILPHTTIGS
jgi:hypothetical protein